MKSTIPVLLLIFVTGCVSVGLYESPELVESREHTMVMGTPLFLSYNGTQIIIPYPELMSRQRSGKNSEITVRWPYFLWTEGGILAGLSGEFRYLIKNTFISSSIGFLIGTKSYIVYGGPGLFLRTPDRKNIAGILLTGGMANNEFVFPYLYRFYFARVYERGKRTIQPGIQLIMDRDGKFGTVFEISFGLKKE